ECRGVPPGEGQLTGRGRPPVRQLPAPRERDRELVDPAGVDRLTAGGPDIGGEAAVQPQTVAVPGDPQLGSRQVGVLGDRGPGAGDAGAAVPVRGESRVASSRSVAAAIAATAAAAPMSSSATSAMTVSARTGSRSATTVGTPARALLPAGTGRAPGKPGGRS